MGEEQRPETKDPEDWLKQNLSGMVQEKIANGTTPENIPRRVPLVIYINEERKIIGDAVITGHNVEVFVDPVKGRDLVKLVDEGIIQSVDITFNAPPATPYIGEDHHVHWRKNF